MRRRLIKVLLAIAAVGLSFHIISLLGFFMLTGRLFPVKIIEKLEHPVGVTAWGPEGLHLSDGRTVQLQGLHSLPRESAALSEVTKRGVQVGPDGRVWGLVRVHHWCGNDPVREHIVRVNVSDMITFLQVGEPVTPPRKIELAPEKRGGTFNKWGWRFGEFLQFKLWESIKDSP